jgi:ribbon-helix-helix CopG family protein
MVGDGVRKGRCMIYIVRRTQLFLDDQLWEALHARARSEKTTISELVRQAARERYLGCQDARIAAMQGFVGIRKSRARAADSSEEVRELRRGSRVERLNDR